jgi:hypothetical protein
MPIRMSRSLRQSLRNKQIAISVRLLQLRLRLMYPDELILGAWRQVRSIGHDSTERVSPSGVVIQSRQLGLASGGPERSVSADPRMFPLPIDSSIGAISGFLHETSISSDKSEAGVPLVVRVSGHTIAFRATSNTSIAFGGDGVASGDMVTAVSLGEAQSDAFPAFRGPVSGDAKALIASLIPSGEI